MTFEELIEEIERSQEEAERNLKCMKEGRKYDLCGYFEGKNTAYKVCLEYLNKYRLSSGSGI